MEKFPRTVLVVQAHPDDTESWCSGTLKLLKDRGYKIVIATMTAGGLGGVESDEEQTGIIRKREAADASAIVGAEYYCLNERDGFLFDSLETRIKVLSLIRRVKAGIVFTHIPNDYHADHRATAQITEVATMQATLVNAPCKDQPLDYTPLFYHTAPMSLKGPLGEAVPPPQFFVDITSVIDIKMKMLSCHQSQLALMKKMFNMDNFFEIAKEYNREIGKLTSFEYAECFWQHMSGGFETYPQIQNDLKEVIEVNNEYK